MSGKIIKDKQLFDFNIKRKKINNVDVETLISTLSKYNNEHFDKVRITQCNNTTIKLDIFNILSHELFYDIYNKLVYSGYFPVYLYSYFSNNYNNLLYSGDFYFNIIDNNLKDITYGYILFNKNGENNKILKQFIHE